MFVHAKPEQKKDSKNTVQKKEVNKTASTPNLTGIPDRMKARFENLSGFSFNDVRVHYNSDKPSQLQAYAYTQGSEVHIAPGQEKHLGHELGHVLQQKQGRVRPTMQLHGVKVNDDKVLESEADSFSNIVQGAFKDDGLSEEPLQMKAVDGVVQREQMRIQIQGLDKSTIGYSGPGAATNFRAAGSRGIRVYDFLNSLGTIKITPKDGPEYDRDAFMCAEPNALSRLLYDVRDRDRIERAEVDGIHFTHKAAFVSAPAILEPPCGICGRWVTNELSPKLKDNIKNEIADPPAPATFRLEDFPELPKK